MPAIEWVACYYANRSETSKDPAARVTIETARELVDAGQATWSKGCKFLRLSKTEASMTPTQRSCKMGPDVIWGCVLGELRDIKLRDAWEPVRTAV